jgi:hypothetical protein
MSESTIMLSPTLPDLFTQIVEAIPYRLVLETQSQGKYWLFVIRLMMRKIIKVKVFP